MFVRERGMAETEVMELGVGIPQIKGYCQWVLISAMSITGMYIVYGRSSVSNPSNDLLISSPPLMANYLLPTPRSTAVAVTFYNFWGFKRLRMTHKISEIIELKFKRLHMSHKECNPRLTKNHLPRLSLVHREVVLNDLLMPLPPLPSQMGGAQNALVVGPSAPMASDDESTRRHEGRVDSPMTMSWSTRNVILSLKSEQCEELKHIQLQAENELRKKITSMRSKHEAELTGGESEGITANAVESFGNKPQEDQEVNSKKVVELDFLYPCEFVP
ncbi:hypothetical protein ACFX15_022295 [Malus domestica]